MRFAQSTDPVDAERVRSVYAQLPLVLFVNVLNCALTGFVFVPIASHTRIIAWFALMVVLSAARLAVWNLHRRAAATSRLAPYWPGLASLGALLAGGVWGLGVLLLFPAQVDHQLFLAVVICGMCAGAATVHAAYIPAVIAFILPSTAPLAIRFLLVGERLQIVVGIMTIVFAAALCVISLTFTRWFEQTLSAKLDLAVRTRELADANKRLTAEVTNHKATEARLRQSQKMEAIGLLTAGIAHDFNNLLMTISGSAGLIARRLGRDSDQAPRLAVIMQAAERGATLTRQLLAFGRKQTLAPRYADLNRMLDGMRRLLETTVAGRARIVFRLAPDLALTFVDTEQLEHAIINVVINARDAMPAGGQVTIGTANVTVMQANAPPDCAPGEYVTIAISDTGTGMTEAVRQKAFDPFFTTKEIGQGSGLGLSQVYGLIRQSGGATEIKSEAGKGTTVCIYLPRAPSGARLPPDDPPPATPGDIVPPDGDHGDVTVLVLDDDAPVRETTASMLREAGNTVIACGTAESALHAVADDPSIGLIIVDLGMPDMPGDRFAEQIRRRVPSIPVLFITGFGAFEPLRDQPWILLKPFDAPRLTAMVARILASTHGAAA